MTADVQNRPRIALTLGDPAGVGPELAVKLLAMPETNQVAEVYVLADRVEVEAATAAAGLSRYCPLPLSPICSALIRAAGDALRFQGRQGAFQRAMVEQDPRNQYREDDDDRGIGQHDEGGVRSQIHVNVPVPPAPA